MINLDYKDGRTLYEQIEGRLKELIINGILKENEQLPSVRELSVSLTVNPNTVQRAYKQLEQEGFIYSLKGKGNFVAPVKNEKDARKAEELYGAIYAAVKELAFYGEKKEKIAKIIDDIYKEMEGKN